MRDIHLHGPLADICGSTVRLEVATAAEAVRALTCNFPEFGRALTEGSWAVVRGEDIDTGYSLGEEEIVAFKLGDAPIHILPIIEGSKRGGLLKAIVGIALIGLSFGTAAFLTTPLMGGFFGAATWGTAARMVGLSMLLGGVSQMMAPEVPDESGDKDDSSFILSGESKAAEEGNHMPVSYGEFIEGGLLISAGIDIEDISVTLPAAEPQGGLGAILAASTVVNPA